MIGWTARIRTGWWPTLSAAAPADPTAVTDSMPALHLLPLADVLGVVPVLATDVLRRLRMIKDAAEIDALRKAGAAIDRVHARVPGVPGARPDRGRRRRRHRARPLSPKVIRRWRSSSSDRVPTAPTRTTSAPTGNCRPVTSSSSTSADRTTPATTRTPPGPTASGSPSRKWRGAIRCCSGRNGRRWRRFGQG